MTITCAHNRLRSALDVCERIISRNLTLPILNNVLLRTQKNKLVILSTNLEIGVVATLPCKVEEEGEVTVPAKVFHGIISNLSADNISLSLKKEYNLHISAGDYSGVVKGEKTDDFPIIPTLKKKPLFTVSGADLAMSLGRVVPFTSVSETRPELTGVFFQSKGNEEYINLVAADGFRLARQRIKKDTDKNKDEFSFIVPQRAISEAVRISKESETAEVVSDESQVEFRFPDFRLVSRLIEGNYVDYTTLIPKEFSVESTIKKDAFIEKIRLVSLLSSRINDVELSLGEKEVALKTEDPDRGASETSFSAQTEGGPLTVSFNWRYLLEGLQQVDDKNIRMRLIDNEKAALIQAPGSSDYIYIVMPLRT